MDKETLESKRCVMCGEFHNEDDEQAYSGTGHDYIQANKIWECDKKNFPDDEAFADSEDIA